MAIVLLLICARKVVVQIRNGMIVEQTVPPHAQIHLRLAIKCASGVVSAQKVLFFRRRMAIAFLSMNAHHEPVSAMALSAVVLLASLAHRAPPVWMIPVMTVIPKEVMQTVQVFADAIANLNLLLRQSVRMLAKCVVERLASLAHRDPPAWMILTTVVIRIMAGRTVREFASAWTVVLACVQFQGVQERSNIPQRVNVVQDVNSVVMDSLH